MRRIILAVCLAANTALAAPTVDTLSTTVKWGYKGDVSPAHWSQLSPDFALCATGRLQSPINISKKTGKTTDTLKMNYTAADKTTIVNDGTTDLEIGNKKVVILDGHSVQINFSRSKAKDTITLDGEDYHLVQFHFHSPSENEIRGQAYPMEIHFVHQMNHKVVVIGVFVKGGDKNPALEKIIDHLPKDAHVEHLIDDDRINPVDLFPAKRSYYRFTGSLTTPPCTEGVTWIVMKDAITASPAQIATLRKVADGANARPVQPLFGRSVYLAQSVLM